MERKAKPKSAAHKDGGRTSPEVMGLLAEARALELTSVLQMLWQEYAVAGLESAYLHGVFEKIGREEMSHSEWLQERMTFLGADPSMRTRDFKRSEGALGMIADDVEMEKTIIAIYRKLIDAASAVKDWGTRHLAEKLLFESEGHLNTFETLLKKTK